MSQNLAETRPAAKPSRSSGGGWWRILLTGLGLYLVGLFLLGLTGNTNLFPTVVMLGSFVVPATYVAFFYEHRHLSLLSMPTTVLSFFWGGVLGVFAATLLEPLFIGRLDVLTAFQVGLIEEFAKILGVLWIARRLRHDSELDGLILGAAAGMGFAALESTGYAFTAFLGSGGSLSVTVAVTLLRGLLSPLGHGTWTAILVGVLFRESAAGRFHVNRRVIGAYLSVVILHGLWDSLPELVSTFVSSGPAIFIAEAAVGAIGLFVLWRRWRESVPSQIAETRPAPVSDEQDEIGVGIGPEAGTGPAPSMDAVQPNTL